MIKFFDVNVISTLFISLNLYCTKVYIQYHEYTIL